MQGTVVEFDELLGEARTLYRLRDERGVYSDIWASGLMRRAVMSGGRRLAAAAMRPPVRAPIGFPKGVSGTTGNTPSR